MSDLQSHSLPRAMKTGRTGENLGTWLEWTQVSLPESLSPVPVPSSNIKPYNGMRSFFVLEFNLDPSHTKGTSCDGDLRLVAVQVDL